ncbi:hypothetical protein Tco_1371885 [Tanacetum coccineum]
MHEDLMIPGKEAYVFYGVQRNPNESPMYLYNKDLIYLKNGNPEENKYVLLSHKIHATSFPENDLEERLTRWVRKVFKSFNKEAQLSIQHWKDSWHKRFYINKQRKERYDPKEVFLDHKIVEVRDDNKLYSFSEADFKNLNKDDIEDMYYLCLNGKVKYHENGLLNSLNVFIRSCVIYDRVHDYQLGIESYQTKVNLTAPTLTVHGIEKLNLYSIVDEPFVGIIYENNKKERRIMNLTEIPKFYDATLEKVLKEVSLKIVESRYKLKTPSLVDLEKMIMEAFEIKIKKRLRHRRQIRRWESFLNGRPILKSRVHPE